MNDFTQNTNVSKKELELLLSNYNNENFVKNTPIEMEMFCEMMKRMYLSCSTNN